MSLSFPGTAGQGGQWAGGLLNSAVLLIFRFKARTLPSPPSPATPILPLKLQPRAACNWHELPRGILKADRNRTAGTSPTAAIGTQSLACVQCEGGQAIGVGESTEEVVS